MKRKSFLAAVSIAALYTPFALASSFQQTPYVGIGFGPNASPWNYLSDASPLDITNRKFLGLNGWQWQAFAGEEFIFNHRYDVAAEFFGGTVNSKSKTVSLATGPNNQTLSIRSNIGFAILPGLIVHDQEIFGRFGGNWSRLKYHTNTTLVNGDTFNTTRTKGAYMLGTGIRAPLNDYLDVRTEFDYSRYKKFTAHSSVSNAQLFAKPRQNEYLVSLVAHNRIESPADNTEPKRGVQVGLGVGRDLLNLKESSRATSGNSGSDIIYGMRGYNFAGSAGYSFNLWHYFVNTLNASASISTAKSTNTQFNNTPATTIKYYLQRLYKFTDQLGYKTSATNLFYATGGWALGRFSFAQDSTLAGTNSDSFTTHRWGWLLGIGDEMALSRHFGYALECDYMHFRLIRPPSGTAFANGFFQQRLLQVAAKLIYTF